ncbi:MAG: hypothetical protein ACFFC9_06125 [Promethearchaeota archaeon]
MPIFSNKYKLTSDIFGKTDSETLKPSYLGITFNKTFEISQSENDAWTNNTGTDYSSETILLGGVQQINDVQQKRICFRWNISIPKHSRIVNAYINITVNTTTPIYTGFTSQIFAINDVATPPFSDVNESVWHTRVKVTGGVNWVLPSIISANESIITPNISTKLQAVINRNDWTNNSIFGVIIRPSANLQDLEHLEIWSFDGLQSKFVPKLYIEWEESPRFIALPVDIDIQNGTKGYYLDWTAIDDNPTTYSLYRNGTLVGQGTWESGTKIRYNIPNNLEIEIYNFTIQINDGDGNYDKDSVLVNVTFLNLPVITDIEFIQNGEVRDYFITGDGPFTLKMYNNTPISVEITLTAFYANYNASLVTYIDGIGWIDVILSPYTVSWPPTYPALEYELNYTNGAFQLTPHDNDQYVWMFIAWIIPLGYYFKNVSSIESNVLNIFNVKVNGGESFIYNDTHYNTNNPAISNELTLNVLNKDTKAPTFHPPELYIPNNPKSNYELRINTSDGEFESGIENVFIYYTIGDEESLYSVEMLYFDGLYYGDIPRQSSGLKIQYQIKIIDYNGNSIETLTYSFITPAFKEPSIITPIIGLVIFTLTIIALSLFFRIRNKRIFTPPKVKQDLIKKKKLSRRRI